MASASQLLADDGHDGPNKGGRRSSGALAPPPPEEGLRCPRCDSPNTKFCYYNNYSLTQPRHYCKACRRYWTRGGALRNVPIGGGCRKNKKSKSSASSSSRFSLDSKDSFSFSSEPGAEFKFFHGFSPDLNLGTGLVPSSRLHSTSSCGLLNSDISSKQLLPYGDLPVPTTAISSEAAGASTVPTYLTGINYSFGNYAESANNTNTHSGLASTIESLSSINQDLHWKLPQQRLAMFFGGESHQESTSTIASGLPTTSLENQHQSISFQMPLNSEPLAFASGNSKSNIACVGDVNAVNEWYLGSSSCNTSRNPGNICTDLIKTWKDMHRFSALP